jgi:hypothetical protein
MTDEMDPIIPSEEGVDEQKKPQEEGEEAAPEATEEAPQA